MHTFTINNEFELTLKDTTEFGTVHIGFKANTDALTDSIEELTNAYNNFIAIGEKYSNNHHNSQLVREMRSIFINMGEDLDAIGFKTDGHGFISVDKDKLSEEVLSSESKTTFTTLNNFKSALSKAADKTDIDPLKYVDKLLVEYKNPGKETNAVYASSVYAGMMLDKSL